MAVRGDYDRCGRTLARRDGRARRGETRRGEPAGIEAASRGKAESRPRRLGRREPRRPGRARAVGEPRRRQGEKAARPPPGVCWAQNIRGGLKMKVKATTVVGVLLLAGAAP